MRRAGGERREGAAERDHHRDRELGHTPQAPPGCVTRERGLAAVLKRLFMPRTVARADETTMNRS